MRLRLTRRAVADAKRKRTWWRQNRDAKELFEEELDATLGRIAEMPLVGQRVEQRPGGGWVRRWLMPKTCNHVYYAVEGTVIVVLAVWGAPQGRGPKL
jgi:plasmid stabilization system protein ParE